MKYQKILLGIGTLLIVGSVIMSIFHLPGSEIVLKLSFTGLLALLTFQNSQLRKRIKELENN